VTAEAAAEIVRSLPPWVTPVGVFVDEKAETIRDLAEAVGLGAVQLHGDEPPEAVDVLAPLKVIRAFGLAGEEDLARARAWRDACEESGRGPDAYMVDARVPGGPRGGTGQTADWDLARQMAAEGFRPLILAGGLGPENVAEAVRQVQPWGVDGASGTEAAPGEKDPERIRGFVEAVRGAETDDI
jgi:phosphoribosylanthranilate isomerase